jgi:hypothetical protein
MTRLSDAGVVEISWEEDEKDGMVYAEGLQSYEIDSNNELAIFNGDKCIKVYRCGDLQHAVSVVYANESVCRLNIKKGMTGNGHKINERGWDLGVRAW